MPQDSWIWCDLSSHIGSTLWDLAVLAEGLKGFKWLALQKAFSEAFKVLNKILKG